MGPARLRLWPGVIIVILQWLARLGAPAVVAGPLEQLMVRGVSGLAGALAVAIWWLFFSRAAGRERWAVAGVMVAAAATTLLIGHESMGPFWLVMYTLPFLCLALVISAAAGSRLADQRRFAVMAGAILITCGPWVAVRIAGITGNGVAEFKWRWEQTPEQRLLALAADEPPAPAPAPTGPEARAERALDHLAAKEPAARRRQQPHLRPQSAGPVFVDRVATG